MVYIYCQLWLKNYNNYSLVRWETDVDLKTTLIYSWYLLQTPCSYLLWFSPLLKLLNMFISSCLALIFTCIFYQIFSHHTTKLVKTGRTRRSGSHNPTFLAQIWSVNGLISQREMEKIGSPKESNNPRCQSWQIFWVLTPVGREVKLSGFQALFITRSCSK